MVSEHSDKAAATAFFKQAIDANGFPGKVVMDKNGANYAGIENINMLLMLAGLICFIEICQAKYLNNLIEQDHWFIKKMATNLRRDTEQKNDSPSTKKSAPTHEIKKYLKSNPLYRI